MKKFITRLALLSLVTVSVGAVPAMETEEASAQGAIVINFGRDGTTCILLGPPFTGTGRRKRRFSLEEKRGVCSPKSVNRLPPIAHNKEVV